MMVANTSFTAIYKFNNSSVIDLELSVKVRWSDNTLKTTAGFYKRSKAKGYISYEIVLSKPILKLLSSRDILSALCHEIFMLG